MLGELCAGVEFQVSEGSKITVPTAEMQVLRIHWSGNLSYGSDDDCGMESMNENIVIRVSSRGSVTHSERDVSNEFMGRA